MDASTGGLGIQRIVDGDERPQLRQPIFAAQAVYHAHSVKLDESEMLNERKNFDWWGT